MSWREKSAGSPGNIATNVAEKIDYLCTNFYAREMSQQQLSEQEEIRRNSLQEIIRLGINPYPSEEYQINTGAREILDGFDPGKQNFREVSIAGRIMSRRIMGNASFAEIQDETGRIQVYMRRDEICPGEDKTLYNAVFE